jgi:hypothetical protein
MKNDLLPADRRIDTTEFAWFAAGKRSAFQWVERQEDNKLSPPPPELFLACRPDAKLRFYKPLEEERGLFLTFAATEPTPEAVLRFADRFGPLGDSVRRRVVPEGVDAEDVARDLGRSILYPGEELKAVVCYPSEQRLSRLTAQMESYAAWRGEISWMRHLTGLWQAAEAGDRRELNRFVSWKDGRVMHRWRPVKIYIPEVDPRYKGEEVWGADVLAPYGQELFRKGELEGPALLFVMRSVNHGLMGGVRPRLFWSVGRRRPELTYVPDDLLAAMYFQFMQALNKGWKYRQCPVCLKSFQLAPGVNRANRLTCSITCRTYLYRQRMEKARELHQKGKTLAAIAKELDTNVKTIKNWIAKER